MIASLLTCFIPAFAMGRVHDVSGIVVSVDVSGKTITVKDETGAKQSAAVGAAALETLKTVKAGDLVTLSCEDDENGNHRLVTTLTLNNPAPR
jgi:hypothetical protein